jgi:hypothetical protein
VVAAVRKRRSEIALYYTRFKEDVIRLAGIDETEGLDFTSKGNSLRAQCARLDNILSVLCLFCRRSDAVRCAAAISQRTQ